jgi:hypothetical protein
VEHSIRVPTHLIGHTLALGPMDMFVRRRKAGPAGLLLLLQLHVVIVMHHTGRGEFPSSRYEIKLVRKGITL